jgi:hypothetical protein
MTSESGEPRYIGLSDYLVLHPEKVDDVNSQVYRMTMDRLLCEGRCEFCNDQPAAWGHDFDDEIVAATHSPIYWLTCAACEQLLADGDDAGVVNRMLAAQPKPDEVAAQERLGAFRRADVGRYRIGS